MAFGVKDRDMKISPGNSYLDCHLIFDVKMYFTQKASFFTNGSTTPIILARTYVGVVSRETLRIAFTYAEFNGLYITAADLQNDYLQAQISERYWNILGTELGP